jgi:NDP-sugar pyrophosphorylase family protein
MKAILLAAGLGTRMRPLTDEKPKQLLEVLGRPLLDHIVGVLPSEVTELVIVVGYKKEMIQAYMGLEFMGRKVTYIEQEKPTGTAHALALAKHLLAPGERFVFILADDIYDQASIKLALGHERSLLVAEVSDPSRFGIVIADAENKIVDFEEKPEHPKSNLAATGLFVLDTHIFDYPADPHPINGEYFLTSSVQKMIKDYPVYIERASMWIPIGYPEDLKKAEEILTARSLSIS